VSNSDSTSEVAIGNLLRAGVIASAFVVALGGLVYLYHYGSERAPDRSKFDKMPPEFSRPKAIVAAALFGRSREDGSRIPPRHGRGRAIIALGVLLLIATPVLRVALSIFTFARQRDLVYVILPMIVLAVLLAGLFSAQFHEGPHEP
jgi:uncharacterized membrane protein